jgi:hypothetical protein
MLKKFVSSVLDTREARDMRERRDPKFREPRTSDLEPSPV